MIRCATIPLLAIAFALAGGCGQMGPLYMPQEAPQDTSRADDAPDTAAGD